MKFKDIIVFDLNGVLKKWHAKEHFETMMSEVEFIELKAFMTPYDVLWNLGVPSILLQNALLVHHPEKAKYINIWFEGWDCFPQKPMHKTVEILTKLHQNGYQLYSITNHPKESFPEAVGKYAFLRLFKDIIISGHVELMKPDPKIFHLLVEKHNLNPHDCIFIDDVKRNVKVATECGYRGIHFKDAVQLEEELKQLNIVL